MAPPIGVVCGIGVGLGGSYNQVAAAIAAIKAVGGSLWIPGLDDWQDSVGGTAAVAGAVLGVINDDGIGLYPLTQATAANKPLLTQVPILGPELVTNGDFSNGTTGWTSQAGWSMTGGQFVGAPADVGSSIYQASPSGLPAGKVYLCSFDVTAYTSGTVTGRVGGANGPSVQAAGRHLQQITSLGTSVNFGVTVPTTKFVGAIDNISVREILGYSAVYTANFDGINDIMTTDYGWTLSDGLALTWCGAINQLATRRLYLARSSDGSASLMLYMGVSGTMYGRVTVSGSTFEVSYACSAGDVGCWSLQVSGSTLTLRKNGGAVASGSHGKTLNGTSLYASIGGDASVIWCNNNSYAAAITRDATDAQLLQIERGLASLAGITI